MFAEFTETFRRELACICGGRLTEDDDHIINIDRFAGRTAGHALLQYAEKDLTNQFAQSA